MSGYASRYAQKNSSAAKDWAAQRQEKINRAKQLREERKKGSVDRECTFQPQKFNQYEPHVGSSKLPGGVSEYSQDYLRDFHYGDGTPRVELDQNYGGPSSQQQQYQQDEGLYSLNRKQSVSSVGSSDSFGLNHVPRRSTNAMAGKMIASGRPSQQQYDPNHYGQQQQQQQQQQQGHDSLANEARRHGAHITDDCDPCDMSYEFAASSSFPKPIPAQQSYGINDNQASDEQVNRFANLRKNKEQQPAARIRNTSAPSSGQGDLYEGETYQQQQPSDSVKRSVSARTRNAANDVCTRQSGCQCSQCVASSTFEGGLRSSISEKPAPRRSATKKKRDVRPPWNSDFAETGNIDEEQVEEEEKDHFQRQPEKRPPRNSGAKPKPSRRNVQSRPPWQGIGSDEQEHVASPVPTEQDNSRVNRMREELRGGQQDFIEQVHGKGGRSTAQPRQSNSRGSNASRGSVSASYRGIYIPPENEDEPLQRRTSTPPQEQPRQQRQQQQQRQQYQYQEHQHPSPPREQPTQSFESAEQPSEIPEYAPPTNLVPCNNCGRKFNEDRIAKHAKVCKKASQSKRKTFDSSKARLSEALQNSEDARVVKDALRKKSKADNAAKKNKWKQQSNALREAMKYNRMLNQAKAEGKDIASLPPPAATVDDDLTPCPHCGRTFNEKAAERHIPKCKDQKAKPNRLMRGGGKNAAQRVKR